MTPSAWQHFSPRTTPARSRCTQGAASVVVHRSPRTGRPCSRQYPTSPPRWCPASITGNVEWSEWDWHGRYLDGSPFAVRGVMIMVIRDGLIAEARLYMEPVETVAEDIDAAVRGLTKQP